jgi:RNA polymerase sigma factor (sigma-70 family)
MEARKQQLERLVEQARAGDRAALEQLVVQIQDGIYQLSLRMLYHPADAEDASQEILVRVVTNLGSFEGRSAFSSWVYRVACNHLLTTRKRRAEAQGVSFALCEQMIQVDHQRDPAKTPLDPERGLLVKEMRLICLQGLLLCLERKYRLAFVLGDVLGLNGPEAAAALDIRPAAFRKRLSRAREQMQAFMQSNCSLHNPAAPCSCEGHLAKALETGFVRADRLLFAGHPTRASGQEVSAEALHEFSSLAGLFRDHPVYAAPDSILSAIKQVFVKP